MYSLSRAEKGISGDLNHTLVGVTYLFAIARNNGTVDLIARKAVQAVGGRVVLIPWVMFGVTGWVRRPLQDQPAADGPVRRARRPGRRLLAGRGPGGYPRRSWT